MLSANGCSSVFQSTSYILQRRPPRIFHLDGAGALFMIQVLAALRAQSFAVVAARYLQRQRQQHLLAQHVFEEKPVALIVTDLGLRVGDRKLIPPRIRPQWTIQ